MTYYRSLAVENALDAGDVDAARAILAPALEQAATTGSAIGSPSSSGWRLASLSPGATR